MMEKSFCIYFSYSDYYIERFRDWYELFKEKMKIQIDKEENYKTKINNLYRKIDFSSLALIISKKAIAPFIDITIQVNSVSVSNNHVYKIESHSDKLVIEFKNKNHMFVFNLEEYFYDFFTNQDYVFAK